MDRREFLKTGAAGALVLAGGSKLVAAPPAQKFKIGLAATQWLHFSADTGMYWKACQEMAQLGFHATEADNTLADLDTTFGSKPAEFKSLSAKNGVELRGVFHSFALWDPQRMPAERKRASQIAKFLKAVGATYIATGEGQRQRQGSKVMFEARPQEKAAQQAESGIQEAIRGLNDLGKVCQGESGIMIGFHPGRGMNKSMIQKILDGTDPRYVGFCADVAHLTAAGFDPVEAVKTYRSRLVASHWKDYDPKIPFRRNDYAETIQGDFVELGRGVVPFPALVQTFNEIGFAGWVMLELDRTQTTPIQSAREMKAYVVDKLKLTL